MAELESYITSNRQLLEKADQINSLLLELKNDTERKEGEKLIAEYNSKFLHTLTTIGNIPALDTKQIEAFKIDTKMHLALEEYVKKHEGNISSYQAQIQVALKAEQEKQEALEAQKKAEQEKKEKEFLESYAGKIDGYQDVKFGMDIDQVKDALGGKCSLYYNADKFRYLASGYSAGTTTVHHDAIRSLMNFYSILYGEKCYQVLSGYPDLSFGFDEDYRLISVLTSNLMNTELINSIQMDQLKEVVKKIKNKYQMWFPPGTTAEDWNSWVNEFNARNTEYILYAFEEGQVMLSIGLGGYKNWQNLYPTTLVMQMLYFSKKNQGAKDFYIGQLDKYAGTSSGKGL